MEQLFRLSFKWNHIYFQWIFVALTWIVHIYNPTGTDKLFVNTVHGFWPFIDSNLKKAKNFIRIKVSFISYVKPKKAIYFIAN